MDPRRPGPLPSPPSPPRAPPPSPPPPAPAGKRARTAAAATDTGGGRRGVRIAEDRNTTLEYDDGGGNGEAEGRRRGQLLLEEAERGAAERGARVVELTPRGVRLARSQLARAAERNARERAAHPGDPSRFLDGELELYGHVSSLKALAADPAALYPAVLEEAGGGGGPASSSASPSLWSELCELLAHPNRDVGAAVVSLLGEWLDSGLLYGAGVGEGSEEPESESQGQARAVAALAAAAARDALEAVVADRLLGDRRGAGGGDGGEERGDEEDDDDDDEVGGGVSDVLSLLESLLEIDQFLQARPPSPSSAWPASLSPDGGPSSSLAAHLCRLGVLRWLVLQLQGGGEEEGGKGRYRDRALEVLVLVASRDDVYRSFPDWSRIGPCAPAPPPDGASNGGRHGEKAHRISDGEVSRGGGGGVGGAGSPPVDAVEALLQAVARFRKAQPPDEAELSALENACLVLDAVLLYSDRNLEAFLGRQGVELALRCARERVHAGALALRWLDVGSAPPAAAAQDAGGGGGVSVRRRLCERAVEAGALKLLFPLLMGRHLPRAAPVSLPSSSSGASIRAKREWAANLESTVISVLYSLTVHLRDDSPNDAKPRLVAKFVEPDKCDRLVELCLAYDRRARQAEFDFYRDAEESLGGGGAAGDPSLAATAALAARLEGGGDALRRACAVAAFCCAESRRCHERILSQLRLQGSGVTLVREALREFAANLDDGSTQKAQIESYLERI